MKNIELKKNSERHYATVVNYIEDSEGNSLLLELIGTSSQIRMFSSVLKGIESGRPVIMDSSKAKPRFFAADIYKQTKLEKGYVHLLVHTKELFKKNSNFIVGRDIEETKRGFNVWLREVNLLPYAQEQSELIYQKMKESG